MRILVTGGAGFIGSHLCDALVAAQHEVLVLDNLSSGTKENLPAQAALVIADVSSAEAERVVHDFQPDTIFHLAAQMDVRASTVDPAFDAEQNVVGTVRIASAAVRARTKSFILASSGGAIYGEQQDFPARESHPTRPESPYGLSKLCAELYLGYFARTSGLRSVALRFANVYGPRQNPRGEAGVVAIFCDRLRQGEPLQINGDGGQTRDFVYVGDVVQACLRALAHPEARGSYNIGTGRETDINAIASLLMEVSGKTVPVRHAPAKPGEQRRSVLHCGHAHHEMGWSVSTELLPGMEKTWRWFASAGGQKN